MASAPERVCALENTPLPPLPLHVRQRTDAAGEAPESEPFNELEASPNESVSYRCRHAGLRRPFEG